MKFLKKTNTKYQIIAVKTPKEKFMDNMIKDILAVRKSKGQELVKHEARLRKLSFDKLQDAYRKEVGKTKLGYRESGKPFVVKASVKPESIKSIWDNEGETADRYTIVFDEEWSPGKLTMLGLSDRPSHPQGFSQFTGGHEGNHLGKKLSWEDLPEPIQKHIINRLKKD